MGMRIAAVDEQLEIIDIGQFEQRMVEVAVSIEFGGAESSAAHPWHHEEHPAVVLAKFHIRWL